MKSKPLFFSVVLLPVVIVALGCGSAKRPTVKTVKLSGTITMDGQPLEGAQVNFLATEYAGVATTDASGRYELEGQPGENTVYIRKFEGVGADFDATMMDSVSDAGGGGGPRQMVPARYSDPSQTELRYVVPDRATSDANFELSSR